MATVEPYSGLMLPMVARLASGTAAIFPIDDETVRYLKLTGRPAEQLELVEAYAKEQGLWHDADHDPTYSQIVELDLGDVEPSLAGPRRPQDRVALSEAKPAFRQALRDYADGDESDGVMSTVDEGVAGSFPASDGSTMLMSSSSVSVNTGSGVEASRHMPCALA